VETQFKIGDMVKDKDGTLGKIVEIKGTWSRFECRPYACLANIICNPKKAVRVRRFWNMNKNLTLLPDLTQR